MCRAQCQALDMRTGKAELLVLVEVRVSEESI